MAKFNLKELFVVEKERLPYVIHSFGQSVTGLESLNVDPSIPEESYPIHVDEAEDRTLEDSEGEETTEDTATPVEAADVAEASVGAESQQIDQDVSDRVNAALQAHLERLEQTLPPGFRGDALNYFVMDPRSLDSAEGRERMALQSMVRGALYDPQRTIAAFIPVLDANAPSKAEQNDGVDSSMRIYRHLTDFLAERGVEIVNSLEALQAHVEKHALPFEPAVGTESWDTDLAALEALYEEDDSVSMESAIGDTIKAIIDKIVEMAKRFWDFLMSIVNKMIAFFNKKAERIEEKIYNFKERAKPISVHLSDQQSAFLFCFGPASPDASFQPHHYVSEVDVATSKIEKFESESKYVIQRHIEKVNEKFKEVSSQGAVESFVDLIVRGIFSANGHDVKWDSKKPEEWSATELAERLIAGIDHKNIARDFSNGSSHENSSESFYFYVPGPTDIQLTFSEEDHYVGKISHPETMVLHAYPTEVKALTKADCQTLRGAVGGMRKMLLVAQNAQKSFEIDWKKNQTATTLAALGAVSEDSPVGKIVGQAANGVDREMAVTTYSGFCRAMERYSQTMGRVVFEYTKSWTRSFDVIEFLIDHSADVSVEIVPTHESFSHDFLPALQMPNMVPSNFIAPRTN